MFRKRIKKEFPAGTFIPTPARVVAILQLCLGFTLTLWYMGQPFMGDLFHIKSQMLIYEDVIGIDRFHSSAEQKERSKRNAERFEAAPQHLKNQLKKHYTFLQDQLNRPLSAKLKRLFQIFAFHISLLEGSLLTLSILIPILLLKRVEGANHTVWLLPALALLLHWNLLDKNGQVNSENSLFPTEKELIKDSLNKPLSNDIFKQREELLHAWHLYLIKYWAHEIPNQDLQLFHLQVEKGEFFFNLKRLELMQNSSAKMVLQNPFILWLIALWGLFFGWYANQHLKTKKANV